RRAEDVPGGGVLPGLRRRILSQCPDGRLPVGRCASSDRCAGCPVGNGHYFTALECALVAVVM
ncbi:unnamed protein product, partial [Darwinula stevensoni]